MLLFVHYIGFRIFIIIFNFIKEKIDELMLIIY